MPSAFAAGAFAFYWTGVTHFCFGFVNRPAPPSSKTRKYLSLGTEYDLSQLSERAGDSTRTLAEIGGREIGFDPALPAHASGHSAYWESQRQALDQYPLATQPLIQDRVLSNRSRLTNALKISGLASSTHRDRDTPHSPASSEGCKERHLDQ